MACIFDLNPGRWICNVSRRAIGCIKAFSVSPVGSFTFLALFFGGCPRLIPITHRILCWLYRRPLDEQQTEKEERPQACTIKEDYHCARLISALNQELGLGRDR